MANLKKEQMIFNSFDELNDWVKGMPIHSKF